MFELKHKESEQRGSFGFPIELYQLDYRHARYVMRHHWHEEYEIIRILDGMFHYKVDDIPATAKAGDVIFVNSGFLHSGQPENCIYECIVFDTGILSRHAGSRILRELGEKLVIYQQLPKTDNALMNTINRLFDILDKKSEGYQLITIGLLYQLFGQISEKGYYTEMPTAKRPTHKKIGQLKVVLGLIENNYHSQLTLEKLAEIAGMSPKYFCEFFRGMTGRTPIDYLNNYRIEVACAELADGECSVTELAYNCGFNDLSYFIRVFKQYKGITPKQYTKYNGHLPGDIRNAALRQVKSS